MNQPIYQPVYGYHTQLLTELLMKTPVLLLTVFSAVVDVQTPNVQKRHTDGRSEKDSFYRTLVSSFQRLRRFDNRRVEHYHDLTLHINVPELTPAHHKLISFPNER